MAVIAPGTIRIILEGVLCRIALTSSCYISQVKAQGTPFNWNFYAPAEVAGFTYRFWDESFKFGGAMVGPPVVPFGFGLSYTTWNYSNLTLSPASSIEAPLSGCMNLTVSATVCNTGSVGSDEVSQSCEEC